MTLRTQFTTLVMGLVISLVTSISILFLYKERSIQEARLKEQAKESVIRFAQVCREAVLTKNDLIAVNYMTSLTLRPDITRAFFADAKGIVRYHSHPQYLRSRIPAPVDIRTADDTQISLRIVKEDRKNSFVVMTLPVRTSRAFLGFVKVTFSQSAWQRSIQETMQPVFTGILRIAGCVLIGGLLPALGMARYMIQPIGRITRAIQHLSQGRWEGVTDVKREDELGTLARAFNTMVLKLRETEEMKREFTSNVTHELTHPLQAIENNTLLLLKGYGGSLTPNQQDYLLMIKNNATRLENFIRQLLEVAKIESGLARLYKEPVNFPDLAQAIAQHFEPMILEKGLRFNLDLAADLPILQADHDKLFQILVNLVSNAMKYTEKGSITLSSRASTQVLVVNVADTGVGMAPEECAKIFDKFYRAKPADGKKRKGAGLGLSIAKGFVEAHGGEIWAASQIGQGSLFTFTIPLKEEAAPVDLKSACAVP